MKKCEINIYIITKLKKVKKSQKKLLTKPNHSDNIFKSLERR